MVLKGIKMLIYLRKITDNYTKKQIETTAEAYERFFGGDESDLDGVCVEISNKNDTDKGEFRITKAGGQANSYRSASAAGERSLSKFLRDNYDNYGCDDILKIVKNKGKYNIDIVKKIDTDYDSLSKLFVVKQNTVVIIDINSERMFESIRCIKLDYNIQNIYFGAPGTGKSYKVDKLMRTYYPDIDNRDNPFIFKTTIYSDYSYYNFIGNIMPTSKNGEIGYDFKAGIFSQALATAFKYCNKEIFLIVEEMSRGNIASVFGDIFQLLDRDENGVSEYSINNDLIIHYFAREGINIGEKIYLPRNFHIIGTVNTSDQNVNVIDTAFKRRFEFIYVDVSPVSDDNGKLMNGFTFTLTDKEFEWNKLYMSLNELITTKLELSEDKQIGQFFIKFKNYSTDDQKFVAIQNKLLHYLWDDVQGAVISDEFTIFNKKYKSFSSLYKDFGKKVNVFSEELISLYDK